MFNFFKPLTDETAFPSKPGSGQSARAQFMVLFNELKDALNGVSTQEAWVEPTLLNGWVIQSPDNSHPAYMKDGLGFVHIKGYVANGTQDAVVFVLPIGYRPLRPESFISLSNNGTPAIGTVTITPNGDVSIAGGAIWFNLTIPPFLAEL